MSYDYGEVFHLGWFAYNYIPNILLEINLKYDALQYENKQDLKYIDSKRTQKDIT